MDNVTLQSNARWISNVIAELDKNNEFKISPHDIGRLLEIHEAIDVLWALYTADEPAAKKCEIFVAMRNAMQSTRPPRNV